MSADNKALVLRYVEEVLNKKNLALTDELVAPAFVDHDTSMRDAQGPAGVKRLAAMVHASFPDLYFTIEDMVAEGRGQGGLSLLGTRHPSRRLHGYRSDWQAIRRNRHPHLSHRRRQASGGVGKLGYAGVIAPAWRAS